MNELFISVEFPEEPTSPPVETGERNDVHVLRCITIIMTDIIKFTVCYI